MHQANNLVMSTQINVDSGNKESIQSADPSRRPEAVLAMAATPTAPMIANSAAPIGPNKVCATAITITINIMLRTESFKLEFP